MAHSIPAIPAPAQPQQPSRPQTPNRPITQDPNILHAPQRPAKFAHPNAQVQPFPILPTS